MQTQDHDHLVAARGAITRLSDGTCGTEDNTPDLGGAKEVSLDSDCEGLTHNQYIAWTAKLDKATREAKKPRGLWGATTRKNLKTWANSVLGRVGIRRFSFSTAREDEIITAWTSNIMLRIHELDDESLAAMPESSVEAIRRSLPSRDIRLP